MERFTDLEALRIWRNEARWDGFLALVPTMGNLHDGHMELVHRAHESADAVIVSIFVNPLQFGPDEDFDSYPRTLDEDLSKLAEVAVDAVFIPERELIYPDDESGQTRISVPGISSILCGASRPGHFDGVATVVAKLFNMIRPEVSVFGEKDYQQLAVIRRMVRDLDFPVEVVGVPTVRESDGLAMSSRNGYLTPAEREVAPELYRTLSWIADRLTDREGDLSHLTGAGIARLEDAGFAPEYLEIREAGTLAQAAPDARHLVVLAAAQLGKARLIDNLVIDR